MDVLVVDVGGTRVKVLATGQKEPRRFDSGPGLVPKNVQIQGPVWRTSMKREMTTT